MRWREDELFILGKKIYFCRFVALSLRLMPILPIDSGRYGSKEMRNIFEDEKRLQFQLDFEATVAQAQAQLGMIPADAANEITRGARRDRVTLARVRELESVSEHDTAAMVEALSEQVSAKSKLWIHYGLTSNDVIDTSICMQMREAFSIILSKVAKLAHLLIDRALQFRDLPAVGRTHGQHASIISFGLKFAVWAVEMTKHIERIKEGKKRFLVCKTLGVVGTGSLMGDEALEVQKIVALNLGLHPVDAATEIGEVAEPFRKGQMGSSAVPVKRNPIKSERVSSLARILRSLVNVSMENIASWHERDLSNSANERFVFPMASILLDEMLNAMTTLIRELKVNKERIAHNIELTKGQIYAEFVLDALIKKGVARFDAYRDIQRVAFSALESDEHFFDAVSQDRTISSKLSEQELTTIFDAKNHMAGSGRIIENTSTLVSNITKKR